MTTSVARIERLASYLSSVEWRVLLMRMAKNLVLPSLVGASMWLQFLSVLHHDPAWLIHGTEVFLAGGKLYRNVFELNPPLIFYLTVPPVWFARSFNLHSIDVFIVYVSLLTALCLGIVSALLRSEETLSPLVRNGVMLATAVALTVDPAERFGQREHLMLILSLPYLFLAAMRSRSMLCDARFAIAIGVLAAFGFALKPHFLLVPAAIECYLVIQRADFRQFARPETLALAGMVALYPFVILSFTPDYLTIIVPFAMAVYGRGYDVALSVVLLRPEAVLLPVIVFVQCTFRRRQRVPELGDILSIASGCFFIIYLVQMKGWSYQIYPLDATLFMLASNVFLQEFAQNTAPTRFRCLTAAIGVLLLAMATAAGIHLYRFATTMTNAFMTDMAPFVRGLPTGSYIYVFTAAVSNGFPLVNYYNLGWSSRFDTFWLLPGLIALPSPPRKIEQFVRDFVVEDLRKLPPAMIFVDIARHKLYFENRDIDYIKYFSIDPRFAAIMADYEQIALVDNFLVLHRRVLDRGP